MTLRRILPGILLALGAVFFFSILAFPDYGSCPPMITGQPVACEHTYPGTSIYISTIWRILTVLSVLSLTTGTGLFLVSRHFGRGTGGRGSDAIAGMMFVSITTAIAMRGLLVPITVGSEFFSISGFLYGIAVGMVLGTGLYLLPRPNVPARPKLR